VDGRWVEGDSMCVGRRMRRWGKGGAGGGGEGVGWIRRKEEGGERACAGGG